MTVLAVNLAMKARDHALGIAYHDIVARSAILLYRSDVAYVAIQGIALAAIDAVDHFEHYLATGRAAFTAAFAPAPEINNGGEQSNDSAASGDPTDARLQRVRAADPLAQRRCCRIAGENAIRDGDVFRGFGQITAQKTLPRMPHGAIKLLLLRGLILGLFDSFLLLLLLLGALLLHFVLRVFQTLRGGHIRGIDLQNTAVHAGALPWVRRAHRLAHQRGFLLLLCLFFLLLACLHLHHLQGCIVLRIRGGLSGSRGRCRWRRRNRRRRWSGRDGLQLLLAELFGKSGQAHFPDIYLRIARWRLERNRTGGCARAGFWCGSIHPRIGPVGDRLA